MPSSFSHPTVFKSIPFVSFRLRLTSRESAIRGLSVSEPEPSISETKPKSKTVTVLLSTIALDQLAGEKSPCHCKKSIVTNYFITLAEGSCNKTVRSRFHRFRGLVLPQTSQVYHKCCVSKKRTYTVYCPPPPPPEKKHNTTQHTNTTIIRPFSKEQYYKH